MNDMELLVPNIHLPLIPAPSLKNPNLEKVEVHPKQIGDVTREKKVEDFKFANNEQTIHSLRGASSSLPF